MEIRKELQDFLNDNNILALIADQAWAELFSEAEINVPYDIWHYIKYQLNPVQLLLTRFYCLQIMYQIGFFTSSIILQV